MFGPVSGGHFNPVVSLVDASFGGLSWRDALAYLPDPGRSAARSAPSPRTRMFARAAISISTHHRASPRTPARRDRSRPLGLIAGDLRAGADATAPHQAPAAVGAYIGAAYWFTSSTSFANPAITIGRMLSNTFAGIAPASRPGFILAQAHRRTARRQLTIRVPVPARHATRGRHASCCPHAP